MVPTNLKPHFFPISSRKNPKYQAVLQWKKRPKQAPLIGVEGQKLIEVGLAAGLVLREVWTTQTLELGPVPHYLVPSTLYDGLSPSANGQSPLAFFERPVHHSEFKDQPLLLLDGIQDPGNAGAIIRAGFAFGIQHFLWKSPCVYPYHPAVIRGSAGMVLCAIHFDEEQLNWRQLTDHTWLVADAHGPFLLPDLEWPTAFVLAVGNEGHGLSEEIAEQAQMKVRIPHCPEVESLNVNGALHIFLYDWFRKRR